MGQRNGPQWIEPKTERGWKVLQQSCREARPPVFCCDGEVRQAVLASKANHASTSGHGGSGGTGGGGGGSSEFYGARVPGSCGGRGSGGVTTRNEHERSADDAALQRLKQFISSTYVR